MAQKKWLVLSLVLAFSILLSGKALAHFGMIIPSDQMIMSGESKSVHIDLLFWHPFEGRGMNLDKPKTFGVVAQGKKMDLLNTLKEKKVEGLTTWETDYQIQRKGLYAFYLEPQPYWEQEEDCFIIHYTKVVVTAFGDDEGWDRPIGLKTEIAPLSKPFGLYAGNVFQGIVLLNGKPVPEAEVEVEYYQQGKKVQAPSDYMITQTIKADKNGVFTYAAPKAGWWGFAALSKAEDKIKYKGEDKEVELGAVIWVQFHDWRN